ncbi:sensor histidine kinase [Azospirillum sp. RWY-5-1]|uniref:histidine kinase n=1 Tax=Azospirillum oleiclasticum TaxID=2735135 RepID=A0ABX2TA44_9PROT|nr:ATP-binding protein [Azospirillum oleiclasticum]NYZ13846.1 sensor histidine kinase [Azospirillum oleiclasticum]NYZ21118.1 sensor histidine kinase [Azospirillum oleiclasticum]
MTLGWHVPMAPVWRRLPRPVRTLALWSGALLVAAVGAGSAAVWSERSSIDGLRSTGEHRLALYVNNLQSAIQRHDYLPFVLSMNADIRELLRQPGDHALTDRVNRYLATVTREAQSATLFVMDAAGLTLAASNWDTPQSFVDSNYGFRPYFRQAATLGRGSFYAVGVTTGTPGHFLSHAVYDGGRIVGVVAVKVSLDGLEEAWRFGAERVLVTDDAGVVFLSSEPAWRFSTLGAPSPADARRMDETRQYAGIELTPLPVLERRDVDGAAVLTIEDPQGQGATGYLAQAVPIPELGWHVLVLSDTAPVRAAVRAAASVAVFAAVFLLLVVLYLRQRRRRIREGLLAREALERANTELRRARDEQEIRIAERTADLRSANDRLMREVAERERAERVLREAQDELVQAGKLATLGQMAAGITHELNQPLAAIRTFADNAVVLAERGLHDDLRDNLQRIGQLVARMARITGQLKAFARKTKARAEPIPVARAVQNALILIEQRLRLEKVELDCTLPDGEVDVVFEEVRLEQVLINLYRNALDAMRGSPVRRLEVVIEDTGERVLIRVRDSGPGIPDDVKPRIFEAFFTTKDAGGLGLGLPISAGIVRDAGGQLTAANRDGGGAEFVVDLARAGVQKDAA